MVLVIYRMAPPPNNFPSCASSWRPHSGCCSSGNNAVRLKEEGGTGGGGAALPGHRQPSFSFRPALTVSGSFSNTSRASSLLQNSSTHSRSRWPCLASSKTWKARRCLWRRNWEASSRDLWNRAGARREAAKGEGGG